jgi:hypothetical protein
MKLRVEQAYVIELNIRLRRKSMHDVTALNLQLLYTTRLKVAGSIPDGVIGIFH